MCARARMQVLGELGCSSVSKESQKGLGNSMPLSSQCGCGMCVSSCRVSKVHAGRRLGELAQVLVQLLLLLIVSRVNEELRRGER